jgi:hypothetical protein
MNRNSRSAAVVVAVIALAGCGGGNDTPRETRDSETGTPQGGPDPQAVRKFMDCLRDNGVDVPKQSDGRRALLPAVPEEVRKQCEKYLPEGAPASGQGELQIGPGQSPGP